MSALLSVVGGDATKPQFGKGHKVICHICNDMGGWGKGFVMSLKETFPKDNLDKHYRRWHKARNSDCRQQSQEEEAAVAAAAMVPGIPQPREAASVAQGGCGEGSQAVATAAAEDEMGGVEASALADEVVAEESLQLEVVAAPPAVKDASAEPAEPWQEPFRLGAVQFLSTENGLIKVANMIAQRGIKSRRRGEARDKVDYEALEEALDKVGRFAAERCASVHMPRIGCGLAGGDWEHIEPVIRATLCEKHGVNVWVYSQ